jgi:hypothetical protein
VAVVHSPLTGVRGGEGVSKLCSTPFANVQILTGSTERVKSILELYCEGIVQSNPLHICG